MRNIRHKLSKYKVDSFCTNVFIDYMIRMAPLGGSTYNMLRMFNRSANDTQSSLNVFARLIAGVEPIIKKIIQDNSLYKQFNIFIVEYFFDSKYSSYNIIDRENEKVRWFEKAISEADSHKFVYPECSYYKKEKEKDKAEPLTTSKYLIEYYLNFAIKCIKKDANRASDVYNFRTDLHKIIEDARNEYVHTGAIIDTSTDWSIEEFNSQIFALLAKFYVSTIQYPTILNSIAAQWRINKYRFNLFVDIVKSSWKEIKDTVEEIRVLCRSIVNLLWTWTKNVMKWGVAVAAALLITSVVYLLWNDVTSIPFEYASFEEIKSMDAVERAELHRYRARLADRLCYNDLENNSAIQVNKRTELLNTAATQDNSYPNYLVYWIPFIEDVPGYGVIEPLFRDWNNAQQEVGEISKSRRSMMDESFDNTPVIDLYYNYYYCDFIELSYLLSYTSDKYDVLEQLERLSHIVKRNPSMEICIVYDEYESDVKEVTRIALRELGVASRQISSVEFPTYFGPKLYLRMDNKRKI